MKPEVGTMYRTYATNDSGCWKFLIVHKATRRRRDYFLGVKVDWRTKKPVLPPYDAAVWFNDCGEIERDENARYPFWFLEKVLP